MDQLILVTKLVVIGLFAAVLIVCVAYASARAASLGWYRSKFDHLRRIMHLTKGDD